MDTKVRELIICHWMHHPRADIEHFYIKRENGGRGLIQLELAYKTTTIELKKYLNTTTDWMLQLVKTHNKQKKKNSIIKERDKFAKQLEFTLKEIYIKDRAIKATKI